MQNAKSRLTRNCPPPSENQTPQQSNVSTDQSSNDETSLSTYFLFYALSTEFLNLEDVIIKHLQIEKEPLRNRLSDLNKRIISLESNHNIFEQYGRRNNIQITGIPDTGQDNELGNKVIEIFDAIGTEAKSADFEDCHRFVKSKNNFKKVKVRFVN